MHLGAILSHLNFGQKIEIFGFFGRKRLKTDPIAPFKRKKGCKNAFQALNFFRAKSSAKIDVFCTVCEFLTPNAETVEGGQHAQQKLRFGRFC